MTTVSIAPIVVRTTNEPAGAHPHGIVLGTGAAPQAVLEDLLTEAERRAAQLAQQAAAAETGLGDATWSFHVAGVRLTAGPGPQPWAAIGTLVTPGEDPWSGSWAQLRRQQAGRAPGCCAARRPARRPAARSRRAQPQQRGNDQPARRPAGRRLHRCTRHPARRTPVRARAAW
jgi:hypothetical protein